LSRIILREALEGSETLDFAFTDLPIELLNDLVGLLGEQQNYEDLEVSSTHSDTFSHISIDS
jgi:hypothetical protein